MVAHPQLRFGAKENPRPVCGRVGGEAGRKGICYNRRPSRMASDGATASTHLSATRHGEADGERSFRFGSRIRRLLAAYRRPAGHKAEAIKAVEGDRRRADRAQRGPRICISSRYSRLVIGSLIRASVASPYCPAIAKVSRVGSSAACPQLVTGDAGPGGCC
jgi:hypothetical protein